MAVKSATTSLSLSPEAYNELTDYHMEYQCKSLSAAASTLILGAVKNIRVYEKQVLSDDEVIKGLKQVISAQDAHAKLLMYTISSLLNKFMTSKLTMEDAIQALEILNTKEGVSK